MQHCSPQGLLPESPLTRLCNLLLQGQMQGYKGDMSSGWLQADPGMTSGSFTYYCAHPCSSRTAVLDCAY